MERKKWRILFFVALALFIAAYIREGSFDSVTGVFAIILIIVGYLTGVLAFLIHLPVVSSVYAVFLGILAKIHYYIFGLILKRVVKETRGYKKTHAKVINSRVYQRVLALFHKLLGGLGIEKSKNVHIFETAWCSICKKEIPLMGGYCPHCGSSLEE